MKPRDRWCRASSTEMAVVFEGRQTQNQKTTLNWGTEGTWRLWCGTSWDICFFWRTRYLRLKRRSSTAHTRLREAKRFAESNPWEAIFGPCKVLQRFESMFAFASGPESDLHCLWRDPSAQTVYHWRPVPTAEISKQHHRDVCGSIMQSYPQHCWMELHMFVYPHGKKFEKSASRWCTQSKMHRQFRSRIFTNSIFIAVQVEMTANSPGSQQNTLSSWFFLLSSSLLFL